MSALGVEITDRESVQGWEAIRPAHVKPAELAEAEAKVAYWTRFYNQVCDEYPETNHEGVIADWHKLMLTVYSHYLEWEALRCKLHAAWDAEKALALGVSLAISLPQTADYLE